MLVFFVFFCSSSSQLVTIRRLSRQCCNLVEEQRAWATLGHVYLQQADVVDSSVATRKIRSKAEHAFLKSLQVCDSLEGDISARELAQMKARLQFNLGEQALYGTLGLYYKGIYTYEE